MLCAKAVDPASLVIFDFNRQVRIAHETLSQQINTVAYVRW